MLSGGCQCGAPRHEVAADPVRVCCCHCAECRGQSSSVFGIPVIVPTAAVRLTAGRPKVWSRPTASGGTLACGFCPDCGSRIWHVDDRRGEETSIKGGSPDGGIGLTGTWHIRTDSKLPGVCLPAGARCFPRDHD